MKLITSLLLILLSCSVFAQEVNIVPKPSEVNFPQIAGSLTVKPTTPIVLAGSGLENAANFLNEYFQRFYGFKLEVKKGGSFRDAITLNYERLDNDIAGAYILNVTKSGIYIAGDNPEGAFYGVQSLIQLLPVPVAGQAKPVLTMPWVSITDKPRFEYRGLHLDVGRHFFPIDFLKKYIDYIALHKMNYFHWHLTEDQGWRIEIKKYPNLTKVGAYRDGTLIGRHPGTGNDHKRYGGFYTQAQVKEIVAYAGKRFITVVPEIEMPGHAAAALASYPYLGCTGGPYKVIESWGVFEDVFCAGNDSVYSFLQNVLSEVMELFPSPYIHIGGDECPKESWKKCPKCQQRMKDNNLKDEHELQSYFVQRMEKFINSKGRKMIGWDEILEGGLAPNATVMSWRGTEGGIAAAKQNHDAIMTPGSHMYLDHAQKQNEDSITIGGYLPLDTVYSYEPVPATLSEEEAKHILGAQGNVWTEYMKNTRKVEYMVFPRLAALSEVLWTQKDKKDFSDFKKRLEVQLKRYELWKVNFAR
ncbi:MAG: beta-N-acetylhexosaminidase [Gemmatimonadaceae bacterium]|nr:beta-N-acetylhexosaminidase [Chitinophagaceae bacterium]